MSEHDNLLIAEYDAKRADDAFAALVRQHLNLVFATALRQVGDAGAAEEITQNVFITLAKASGKLKSHPTIAGWLYQTTLNKSREWLRSELRRRHREDVAVQRQLAEAEGDSVWSPLVPLLDEALLKLREPDRLAVIMHFMEGQTFEEVGTALGVGEDTARKRVNRCLHQLTHFFQRRGFAIPALTAATPLFGLASHTAPTAVAGSITTASLAAAHSATSTSTLTLLKGALKVMAWTNTKTTMIVGAVILLSATSATIIGINIAAKMAQTRRSLDGQSGLSPIAQIMTADIQPNGSLLFKCTIEETNNTSQTFNFDNINDGNMSWRVTDESGRPLKISRRSRGGIHVELNRAVPSGGTIAYTVEGKFPPGIFKANGGGEWVANFADSLGNITEAHVVRILLLPPGAILMGKVHGITASTNEDGRIALTTDVVVPPNGTFPTEFRYRLQAGAH